ncbi:hypothetical protein [Botryobacter ruber]|uniref:hypothetical protein n=1 Tax=Botryobacter ruber TaxID=2171629 RepID=UPI000E0BE918|nr:hypothetical protein [Botryobacter ruber]
MVDLKKSFQNQKDLIVYNKILNINSNLLIFSQNVMKQCYSVCKTMPLHPAWFDSHKLLCAFLVLVFFFFGMKISYGQVNDNQPWTLHSTSGKVSVYYTFSKCEQQDVVLIKFSNAGNKPVEVSWKEKLSLRGKDIQINNSASKTLLLAPGETVAKDCADGSSVLVTPAYQYVSLLRPGLTRFEIYDLVVVEQK